MPAPKKTAVNAGPKKICPRAAFCSVEMREVEGSALKIMEYHKLAAGPKNSNPTRKADRMRENTMGEMFFPSADSSFSSISWAHQSDKPKMIPAVSDLVIMGRAVNC